MARPDRSIRQLLCTTPRLLTLFFLETDSFVRRLSPATTMSGTRPPIVASWIMLPSLFVCWMLLLPAAADVGLISFWTPELLVLLQVIQREGSLLSTHTFGGRRFYVTTLHGHNVVLVNGGESMTNAAATTATLLQKFPSVTRIVASGIAGGVDPARQVGDVVVPAQWALHQEHHYARIRNDDGTHDLGSRNVRELMGDDCGYSSPGGNIDRAPCDIGTNTWNFTFMYPLVSHGADPNHAEDPTIESSVPYKWLEVDPEMLDVAATIAANVTLSRGQGELTLDYEPVVVTGGNGVSASSFVDNAEYRDYVFQTFQAVALDKETASLAFVAAQFGVGFICFRSLANLAGAEDTENVVETFYHVATANAGIFVSEFFQSLTPDVTPNITSEPIPPADYTPGDDETGLLGVLCFDASAIPSFKASMTGDDTSITEHEFGGRKFYRGTMEGFEIVLAYTGSSTSNAAMTTALMIQLFPGLSHVIGTGIAKLVDPALRTGDVLVPERLAMNQEHLLAKEPSPNLYVPLEFLAKNLVGRDCGGFDGVDTFLTGDRACDASLGETSNFGFFFPETVATPEPLSSVTVNRITEGQTRKWWFDVDESLVETARVVATGATTNAVLESREGLQMPNIIVGGNSVSGSAFIDNDGYRMHIYQEFDARCTDREAGAVAHVAYENNVPFLFILTLSTQAGSEEAEPESISELAANNSEAVIAALLREVLSTNSPTSEPTSSGWAGDGKFVFIALFTTLLLPFLH